MGRLTMDLSSEDSKPIPIPTADTTEVTLQDLGEEELHRAFQDDICGKDRLYVLVTIRLWELKRRIASLEKSKEVLESENQKLLLNQNALNGPQPQLPAAQGDNVGNVQPRSGQPPPDSIAV